MFSQPRSSRPFGFLTPLVIVLLVTVVPSFGDTELAVEDVKKASSSLPPGHDCVVHVYRDVVRYWQMDSGFGKPRGIVPSFRFTMAASLFLVICGMSTQPSIRWATAGRI